MSITYNPNIFAPFHIIGGRGGNEFQWINGTNGALIKKLEVWTGGWQLRGIKVTLTNGAERIFGKPEDRHAGVFEFQPGERVIQLSIWGNGAGTRCGGFKIKTNKNREYFPHMYDWGLKTEYKMNVGSGLLCGLYGGAGSDIDRLGFAFLRPLKNSVLQSVTYPTLSTDLVATTPVSIDTITIDNLKGTVPQKSTLKGSQSFTVQREWTKTTGIETSVTSTVKAGIPEVAEASVETKLSISQVFSFKRSESQTLERAVSHEVLCPPNQKLRAEATTYQDKLNLPYNGRFEVELDSGTKFSYNISGVYNGTSVRSVFINYDVLETAEEATKTALVANLAI